MLLNSVAALQDYPDHRLKFFSLLRAITNNCFSCLYSMTPTQLKLVRLELLCPPVALWLPAAQPLSLWKGHRLVSSR